MAQWSAAFIDSLPDSSFLYVEDTGKKDSDGRTVPLSARHFPVKDEHGMVDVDHVRNALARIPDSNVPESVKADATAKAQAMLKAADGGRADELPELERRDSRIRTSLPFEVVRNKRGMPTLHGRGAVYDEWTEINSRAEGHFMERFAPGAFTKTISEQRDKIRCLFNHGQDPSIGMKPLGKITGLEERGDGVHYEVDLLDTDYCRSLVPGLEAGLYGSSFRFGVVNKSDVPAKRASNGKGIQERTITEAYMRELGPTPFPAYGGTTASVRSITDEILLGPFPAQQLVAEVAGFGDRDLVAEMKEMARAFIASGDTDEDAMRGILVGLDKIGTTAHSKDAAGSGTSRKSAASTSNGRLYGLDRDGKDAEGWRL